MYITDVIISPLVTEKSNFLQSSASPKLSFIVNKKANKTEIKKAFFAIFGFHALSVNTLIRKPQPARMTVKSKNNFTKAMKIAYISVSKENYDVLKNTIQEAK